MIIRRDGWYTGSLPKYNGPKEPTKPSEMINHSYWDPVITLTEGDSIDNALLNSEDNLLLENLTVHIEHDIGWYDTNRDEQHDCDLVITLGRWVTETRTNPNYVEQMKVYEERLKKWELAQGLYKKEVEEWKIWAVHCLKEELQVENEKKVKNIETLASQVVK